jgi:WD40 repeat protein
MSETVILRSNLVGHNSWVNSVIFNPRGSILATGSDDNTVKLWLLSADGLSARCVDTLNGHRNAVLSISFHPTLPILATGSGDNTVKLWLLSADGLSERCVDTLEGHAGPVFSVAFHPRLPILATGSGDNTAKLWQLSVDDLSARCVNTLRGHRFSVNSVAFHPILEILATGSGDNTAKLWLLSADGLSARCVNTLRGHRFSVNSVAFHPRLPILATGSGDNTAKLWQLSADGLSERCVDTLNGHLDLVLSIDFHPTEPILATGSWDDTTKLWLLSADGLSARCVNTLNRHTGPVYSVKFHPTAPILVTGNLDRTVQLWELNIRNIRNLRITPTDSVSSRQQQRNNSLASTNLPTLTFSTNHYGKRVIHIPIQFQIFKNNSANKSCPGFIPLYDQLMLFNLDNKFRFEFQGQNAFDSTGLTRIVFDKLLPIYTKLFFEQSKKSTFIILKEKVDENLLFKHTSQIIKLAKAAHSQILLEINPELIDLLLSKDLKNYFSNNKIKNNKTKKDEQLKKFYIFVNQAIQNNSFDELNNKSNNTFLRINKNNNNINRVITKYKTQEEGEIKKNLLREIRLRRFLVECGFSSWEEVQQMYKFIQAFWNISNEEKITVRKNGREVRLDLFVPILKLDVESFKRRIKIIREDTGEIIDLSSIRENLFREYPAFKPLLEYILNPSKEANENRKTFVNYVTGTEYSPAQILIKLTDDTISPELHSEQPFYGHSCENTIDLYRAPSNFRGVITQNEINTQLKATISNLIAEE